VKVALVGQPNCGKSTLFNAVAGYRSLTSNFAGTTVEYTRGQARVDGVVVDLVDLPGLYSLTPTNPVEAIARECLLSGEWDVFINVIDASQLARSLELTLELTDLQAPLVICLNMMDEAARKGIVIDSKALSVALGAPVVEAIAARGQGILESFRAALAVSRQSLQIHPQPFVYAPEAEDTLARLAQKLTGSPTPGDGGDRGDAGVEAGQQALEGTASSAARPSVIPIPQSRERNLALGPSLRDQTEIPGGVHPERTAEILLPRLRDQDDSERDRNDIVVSTATARATAQAEPAVPFPPARFEALQLIQSDPRLLAELWRGHRIRPQHGGDLRAPAQLPATPSLAAAISEAQDEITRLLGQPADAAISSARHAACLNLFERIARVTHPRRDWRERVDRLVMHPVWGYAVLVLVFLGIFQLIFTVGKFAEDRILGMFSGLIGWMSRYIDPQSVLFAAAKGALLGMAGAVAIVLPYLLPFLVCLAVLEDLGYLSRVGYLMDALMHRLGLHGTATLPVLLGYGCSVPAVMATRILSSRRDRFIAAFLAVLVPCSARMTVILALVGVYLGAYYALGIYVLNLLLVVLAGHILALIWPEISPGMLMEVPAFRLPAPKVVMMKTWWRLREFVMVAFPLLVAGSAILSLIEFCGWQHFINAALSPLTALLGLPRAVGLTLIFGVLRKELSLLMLMQALGTTQVASVMSVAQILIFTLFVTFYLPCMATLASMFREVGWRLTAAAATALLVLAVGISLAARCILAVL
jgi:small GTP-binding protein